MFQQNESLKEAALSDRCRLQRRWPVLCVAAVLIGSVAACAPSIKNNPDEKNSEAISEGADASSVEAAAGKSKELAASGSKIKPDKSLPRNGIATSEKTREILLIEPRPDRETPLRDCGSLQKQQAINACAYENYQTVDAELNEAYQGLRSALPSAGKQALETAELAWIKFRDLDCDFERNQFEGGSIAPLIYHSCLESRTNIRLNELYEPATPESNYAAADSALNAAYQGLTSDISGRHEEKLVDAQLAWIEYRDRHCKFEANYGVANITEDQCKARLSEKRTRQIRAAIESNSL